MTTMMKVSDIMSARVIMVAQNSSAHDAAKVMKQEDVGSVVVCEGSKPIGIVTREDITNKVAALDKQASKVLVKEIMSSPVVTAAPDEDMVDAAKRMNKYGYERLPVKQLNKLVGFISVRDILRVSPGMLELLRDHFDEDQVEEGREEQNAGECELCGNYTESLHSANDKWVCDTCKEEAEEV